MGSKKRDRIIGVLRRQFPDLQWHYEFPSRWMSSAGWGVQAYSQLAWFGSDDDYSTVYRRTDTQAVVYGLDQGRYLDPADPSTWR